MCSKKRLAANRQNALQSTGPTSEDGKAICRRNAVVHGLSAANPIVLDEDPVEFAALAKQIVDEFRPATPMENLLVERIVHQSWKIRRVPDAEREAFVRAENVQRENAGFEDADESQSAGNSPGKVMAAAIDGEDETIARVQGYEQRIERSIYASIRALRQLRKDAASQVPVNA